MNCEEDEKMKVRRSRAGGKGRGSNSGQRREDKGREGKKKERRCVREPETLLLRRITREAEIPSFPTYLELTKYHY